VDLDVALRSGDAKKLRQERPSGRTPQDPTPPERLKAKFESCAARTIGDAAARRLYGTLERLDEVGTVRDSIVEIETEPA
jgi:hypothetical protein